MSATLRKYSVPILSLLTGLIVLLAGPVRFDAIDGAEFAVAGCRLDIAHPPGYPLFLWLVRLTGMTFGHSYVLLRLLNCVLAAAAYWIGILAFRSLGAGRAGSLAGPLLLLTLPPVLSQMVILEVHTLAILLILCAIAYRSTRAGPYLFSLAVFGGHPAALILFPLVISERMRSRWLVPALIPVSLWFYTPLRASLAGVAHYTRPDSIPHLLSYFGLYGNRLSAPSLDGLAMAAAGIGLFTGLLFVLLAVTGAGKSKRILLAVLTGLLFLSVYQADDIDSMAWILLLPVSLLAARGISRAWNVNRTVRAAVILSVIAVVLSGLKGAERSGDNSAWLLSRDMLGSVGPGSVYCTISHDTFYLAYLLDTDDLRPDVIPSDLYGNYFHLDLDHPLPADVGGREVYSTRAWTDPGFTLEGLLFVSSDHDIEWDRFDIFRFEGRIVDRRTRDGIAEAWIRRALQEPDRVAADSLGRIALYWASTGTTVERIEGLLENL